MNCGHDNENKFELPTSFKNDSISLWITFSKNTTLPLEKRRLYLEKAHTALKSGELDTFYMRTLSAVAYQYLKLKDTLRFKELNKETFQSALKLKDTFALADIHWNEANYYKKIEVYDTAYYHYDQAYKYFESIDEQNYSAKMLYGMSFIKGRFRDYSGSEILIVKAISKYKLLKENEALYASYNHLALLQNDIKEYNRALFYHNRALEYLDKLENKIDLYKISLNNIGNVYVEKGEYGKALSYYDKVLEDDSLKIKDIERYARVLDNITYCKLLKGDTTNLKQDFYRALKIRDSTNNKAGIVTSKIHLSEYFAIIKDSLKAINYAKEANVLSWEIKNSKDYLKSLNLLSKLDSKNAEDYLGKYITYSDSLQNIDRKTQNKFTRIAYETDEYIEETKRLSLQKTLILISALVLIIIISLVYYIMVQKSRTEKLLLETEQQKANEQVYILTLKQQVKLEEEKTKERNRISQDLHDGILGKLFGVRIDLGFLEIKGDSDTLKKHESFLEELQGIEAEIREVSHRLNTDFNSSEIDFSSILGQLLENKSRLGNFTYQLDIDENIGWSGINEIIKVNLYRILQEALQNVVKYSRAQNVSLSFSFQKNNLTVKLNDNGAGFNIKKQRKGIGIKNMKSRIEKLNGRFNVQSEIDKGTTVHFTIPIH
ncbi:tetratricopeptide repeat-containing sensor histidine kinase [Gillisia sp. Hel_I_86]|uniref:tetratricopeptide repeat-containing sensor histidine kinase n=1 Tax=Gillisia sp. Hel_I_86 TaxID=1249981 RepID=UPI00119D28EA|nr:tetratricopeptide repeat-containing sensor histidine kinase [Gillisia sp. Hel_I_86]